MLIKIKVCDAIMGAGKTTAAIHMMNANPTGRYLFVTPYLSEIQRIKTACPALSFYEPESRKCATKTKSIEHLFAEGCNIACTHALFGILSPESIELIRQNHYTMILDEVMNVIEVERICLGDIQFMFDTGLIRMADDGYHVEWQNPDYKGSNFANLMQKAQLGNLIYYKQQMMFWTLPVENFEAFDDIYILTYMFEGQMQRYYYEMNGVDIEYIGTRIVDGTYEFSPYGGQNPGTEMLLSKLHILDTDKWNQLGQNENALSSGWYKRGVAVQNAPVVETMAKNMFNIFKHIYKAKTGETMWTVFKPYRERFGQRGYKKDFVSCGTRATNEYRDRHYLAYLVNVYFNPVLKHYFEDQGVKVDEDAYALSEMVQWIWRSAIRCGEEIWIYIPSKRMRGLLTRWLRELAGLPPEDEAPQKRSRWRRAADTGPRHS